MDRCRVPAPGHGRRLAVVTGTSPMHLGAGALCLARQGSHSCGSATLRWHLKYHAEHCANAAEGGMHAPCGVADVGTEALPRLSCGDRVTHGIPDALQLIPNAFGRFLRVNLRRLGCGLEPVVGDVARVAMILVRLLTAAV